MSERDAAAVSEEVLAEIERVESEATPPPWSAESWGEYGHVHIACEGCGGKDDHLLPEDAWLIALLRNRAPALVSELRRLRERLREVEGENETMKALIPPPKPEPKWRCPGCDFECFDTKHDHEREHVACDPNPEAP
jgi:hypothetical protein